MNKKQSFKAGLNFGIGMTVFFILQNLLMNENQTTNQVIKSIAIGLLSGVVAGVLFGLVIGIFLRSKLLKNSTKVDIDPGENVLLESPANHFKGIEAVGGKLYLTNKRIIFKSHKLNIQVHQLSIKLEDIKKFERYKTLGLVNNGLSLTTVNETTEKFVVNEIEEWTRQLEGMIG